jgi:PIN domain nuclease of toxin-antitoxin system
LGSLNSKLEQMTSKLTKKLPEEFLSTTAIEIGKLVNDQSIQGLSLGEKAPLFTLPDATGKNVSLSDALSHGSVVLSFYRGSW